MDATTFERLHGQKVAPRPLGDRDAPIFDITLPARVHVREAFA
jgi:hypothetical protein